MMARGSLLIAFLVLVSVYAEAQSFYSIRRDRSLLVTGGSGTSTYFGELQNPGDIIDLRPNLNVGLQYMIGGRLAARAEANWFQLAGDDAKADDDGRVPRNLSFRSNSYEISVAGMVFLFPNSQRFYQRPTVNPYGFLGVGYLYFNPTAEYNGQRYALQPLMTEDVKYSRSQIVIPYGLGVKLKVGPFFNFSVEGGYRQTFTDYLDDVSTVHPDKSTWTDPIRIALSDRRPEYDGKTSQVGGIRGNPDRNDGYFLMNAKVEYYLPTNFLFKNAQQRRMYKQRRRSFN